MGTVAATVLLPLLLLLFPSVSYSAEDDHLSPIRNLRAHYEPGSDSVVVDWEWREVGGKQMENYDLFVRYKVSTGQEGEEWRRVDADDDSLGAKIPIGRLLGNGDELTVQVFAEAREPEDGVGPERSEPLVIWIARRTENREPEGDEGKRNEEGQDVVEEEEEELIPPFNFTANVLSPEKVLLEWKQPPLPHTRTPPFYIVNVRQLSANTGDRFPPQQLRVDNTHFVLGSLVAGESYEFTIRTALGSERVSSAAAIVEIALPNEDELIEVGNLIVTSRFRPDGHGVVNLTWEVPSHLRGKIRSYEMRYTESERANGRDSALWEHLFFPGNAPQADIYNMRPDTEYVLRIRTSLSSGVQVESGEFRFRTPKTGGVNPLARLDVLYSSESPTVRLQWILAPHISNSLVGGYDVYISDRYDLPEQEWNHRRVQGRDPQTALDSLNPSTTYFVRIDVRNLDGTVAKSPSVYRFTTLDNLPPIPNRSEFRRGDSLAFEQIGKGKVQIVWEFPEGVLARTRGTIIYYSSDKREPLERWHRLEVTSETRSVVLVGLRENVFYHVQIVPMGMDGRQMWPNSLRMQLKATDGTAGADGDQQYRKHPSRRKRHVQTALVLRHEAFKMDGYSHR